ncbi:uncharacterized protein LOC143240664 isoform X1 [Tachypleus tridentatus]|uniref:uncharacterized protein LOC143240664 isoform X1 n=1 Tax=Tachypleus tridentatus TaxID=6853 RepID=UPI003FD69F20
MKCVQLSGAQKRKLAKKNQQKAYNLVTKTGKLTNFFTQLTQRDLPNQNPSPLSEVTCTASDFNKIEVEPSSTSTSTTLSTSRSEHYDDVEVSQAGSTGTSLTTLLMMWLIELLVDPLIVNTTMGLLTILVGHSIVANQRVTVRRNFYLG